MAAVFYSSSVFTSLIVDNYFLVLCDDGLYDAYIWKQISAHVLGGVNSVTSFITIDEQSQ